MLFAALMACVHPPPPGPTPAERAAALPAPLELTAAGERAHVLAVVRAGSAHDPVGAEGTAWLTAQLILQGGSAQRPAPVLEAELEALDAELSVQVSRELVIFHGEAPPENAATLASRMGELITRPALDPAALSRLQGEARQALLGGLSGPDALAAEALDSWLNQGHPYGHPVMGRTGVLDRIDREDLREWHAAAYTRQATALGVAGPAGITGEVALALTDAFAWLPAEPYKPYLAIRADGARGRALLAVEGPPGEAAVRLGLPLAVAPGDTDWLALSLAALALGAAEGSPVIWAGPTAAPTLPDTFRPQTQLTIQLAPQTPESALFALRSAVRRLEQLLETGMDDQQVDVLQQAILAGVEAADPVGELELELAAAATGLPPLDRGWLEGEGALDAAAVNRALRAQLDPDALRMVVVTDEPGAFVEAVLEDAEAPAVYGGELPDTARLDDDAETASWPLRVSPDRAFITRAGGLFQ